MTTRPLSPFIKGIQVTEENLPYIMQYGKERYCNLDYLGDNRKYNLEVFLWDTYLVTDGSFEWNNFVFTEFAEPDFRRLWQFAEQEDKTQFVQLIRAEGRD